MNEGNSSATVSWQRMVGKLLFLLCRVTTMLMRLVFAKVDLTSRNKPFSVWKNKHIEMDDTVSEMMHEMSDLESLRSFQLVSEPPSPTHSHVPSTTSSTIVEHYTSPSTRSRSAENLLYANMDELVICGSPRRKGRTTAGSSGDARRTGPTNARPLYGAASSRNGRKNLQ